MAMSQHAARPSLSGRPISTYSAGADNLAGVGLHGGQNAPVNFSHIRSQSQSAASAYGRPASSFYALDGHSGLDSDSPTTMKYLAGSGNVESQPNSSQVAQMRRIGHGDHDRASRVSFADNTWANSNNKHASLVSHPKQGVGSAASPNHHRYKSSIGQSISSLPMRPSPASGPEDVAYGVDSATPRSLSHSDVVGMLTSADGLPNRSQARLSSSSPAQQDEISSLPINGVQKNQDSSFAANMPFIGQPVGRDTILSPDYLLQAYASKTSNGTAPMQRSETAESFATVPEHDQPEELNKVSNNGRQNPKLGDKFSFRVAK